MMMKVDTEKYEHRINQTKAEINKIQEKVKHITDVIDYFENSKFLEIIDWDDECILREKQKLLEEEIKGGEEFIQILQELIQKINIINQDDDEENNDENNDESEYNSSYEETEVDVNESDCESDEEDEENNINENIKNENIKNEPDEFNNIDNLVKISLKIIINIL